MRIQIQVDADEFWPSLQRDIKEARDYVFLQSLSFEGDSVGRAVANELLESKAKDRRVIADEFYTVHRINDHYLHNPKHWFRKDLRLERAATLQMMRNLEHGGVGVKLANPSGPFTIRVLDRNHKKIAVVDDRVAYIGGINFSEHNFAWHDMMLRIEDADVTRFLAEDFEATWRGENLNTSRAFEGIEMYRFDGLTNPKAFQPILDLIANARESVFIVSPYITYPFFEAVRRARSNGAKVVLIAPDDNNWGVLREYLIWEAARWDVDLMLYEGRMSHLKAILVDDAHLIAGSSNFDFLSYRHMQEIVGVVTDRSAIDSFKRSILEPDLARSHRSTEHVSQLRGFYHLARLKIWCGVSRGFCSLLPGGRFR
jgi:cardiolipin synthase